jgi:ligand-binding sensor domain-containing protein
MYFKIKTYSKLIKDKLIICIIIVFLGLYTITFSQQNNSYFFRHIDQQNGVSNNNVYGVTQDAKGFIWIVTENGLQRFDGTRFINFSEIFSNSNTEITEGANIYFDNKNNFLWIFNDKSIEKYEPEFNRFTVYKPGQLLNENEFKFEIYCDVYNNIWLLSNKAILKYDSTGKNIVWYNFNTSAINNNVSDNFITDTAAGETWVRIYGRGLLLFDHQSKKIYSCDFNPRQNIMLEQFAKLLKNNLETSTRNIMQDSKKNFWIASWKNLFYKFSSVTKKISTYSLKEIIKKNYTENKTDWAVAVTKFFEDKRGGLWVTTENAGLLKYNTVDDNFEQFFINAENKKSKVYNFGISNIFEDKQENIWLSTDKGITVFNPYHQYFKAVYHQQNNPASLPDNEIECVTETQNGEILAGTWGGGITVFDSNFVSKKSIYFKDNTDHNAVWCFMKDNDQNIWAGCQHGYIHIYNPVTHSLKTIHPSELNNSTIRCMAKDAAGNILFGLHNGKVDKWNKQQNKFYAYTDTLPPKDANSILNIFIDNK